MLLTWFLYMIVPFVGLILSYVLKCDRVRFTVGFSLAGIIDAIFVYFALISKNLLSIIGGNFISGLIMTLTCFTFIFVADDDNAAKSILTLAILTGLCFVVWTGGELHSHMSVKPTWDSISKTYSKSTKAPTFKRNETPIALAPATVLNRVRKSASDIPHSQYYSIPKNVQAQYYKGKPVYVVPVEYNGFFQMRKAQQIPGYFIIDATKQNATPKFIKKPYVYATSAYFGKDVSRQFYKHLSTWLTLGNPQLEINEQGKPYWVQTIYKSEALSHRVNFERLHVGVMDAQTGNVKVYSLKNMPKFIDEGITTETANKINQDFGAFKYGFWNAHFSKTDVIKPTKNGVENGVTSVFNKDGSISYFADFTTDKTGSDSTMGYSMINARTGELTYYKASNLMDSDGAKHNADQDYKAQQWKATMPVLYNIDGNPTWVMTILDSTHAIRGYYYLNASDQSIYATGSTPTSALDEYRQALVNNGGVNGNTPKANSKLFSGKVDRVALVTSKNKVLFTLANSNIVFSINTNDYMNANLLRTGDEIEFKASVVNGKPIGNVSKFKNMSLK